MSCFKKNGPLQHSNGHGVLGNKVPSTELAHPVELQAALALVNIGLRVVSGGYDKRGGHKETSRRKDTVKVEKKRSHLELGDAREDGGTVSADVTLEIRFE